ncbi:IucA/IucC family siderophore biosynthesis protein [Paenibacillus amylolyticus]|uniref:IucA/IucC family protein n=1 Tax=Paenibacillus amylolyticus TaxID=1451 RepID=UPI00096CF137|nr:IucA/IucC family protein [Paenibacillus amylolyticus]OMF02446.1 IucA/IucC family siderophore biosynthesis protein [Paenibacillus amylolyticus]
MGVVGYRAEAGSRTEAVYVGVQERIMRQTLEAMWFEGILDSHVSGSEWQTEGLTSSGKPVAYTCEAERKFSFGRVKVKKDSIQREGVLCTDLDLFLEEIVLNALKGANVKAFIQELLETMAKDSQCRAILPSNIPSEDRHYDALESHMTDGHLYHPSYKSRLGFSLKDNLAYGPEFNSEVSLVWVAVKKDLAQTAVSVGYSSEELVGQHLTAEDMQRFQQILQQQVRTDMGENANAYVASADQLGSSTEVRESVGEIIQAKLHGAVHEKGETVRSSGREDGKVGIGIASDAGDRYVFIPVHPWQWEHQLKSVYARQLMDGDIVYLGPSSSPYRAQQSIRSLSNRVNPEAPYIKLALSITNTSSTRILAQHTTQNAPLISDWLDELVREDELLQQAQFGILKEIMGLSFRYEQLPATQYGRAYGTLGAIWRENVSVHLKQGETAWPLNALMLVQPDGVPFIQDAVERHGVEKWSEALVRTVTLPIIHLLYAHGIALESHAQNIILVLEDDLPKRIIIKDLHDGVRYVPDQLLHPERAPKLNPEPETHRKFNRYSFIYAGDVSEVRDYTYDAFFFICMTDIALALEKFGLSEEAFWQLCAGVIVDYQKQHPEYTERFVAFDLFAEDALIEEMTKRRLYGDGELYFRKASNPLKISKDVLESNGTPELKGIVE